MGMFVILSFLVKIVILVILTEKSYPVRVSLIIKKYMKKLNNVLIIGWSKGLGNYLSEKISENENVYVISRTNGILKNVVYLNCDI